MTLSSIKLMLSQIGAGRVHDFLTRTRMSRLERICARSGLVDGDWYLAQYPDVAGAGVDPVTHYVRYGAAEGRNPNALFDSHWYLIHNPDVAAAGINPLVHYIVSGAAEGRDPSPLFDTTQYLKLNPHMPTDRTMALAHLIREGQAQVRSRAPASAGHALPEHPRISAIIPCYNGARWLADAVESVRAQTLPVHEIIVVDDASTDDSGVIARKLGARVLRNPVNRGEGFSRNVGLKRASGELIAWLDADDMWMPHHLSTLTNLLKKYPQAAVAFGAVQRFGLRNELIRGYVPPGPPSNVFWLAFRDWVHTTIGSVVRRAALLDIGGFDERERYSVDFDLWLRLSRFHLFVCTHEVTSLWRWHDAQQSTRQREQITALYRFRRQYWERERAAGSSERTLQMQQCMVDIWQEDMTAAWEERDFARLRAIGELAMLVPGISDDTRAQWRLRVEAAEGRPPICSPVDGK